MSFAPDVSLALRWEVSVARIGNATTSSEFEAWDGKHVDLEPPTSIANGCSRSCNVLADTTTSESPKCLTRVCLASQLDSGPQGYSSVDSNSLTGQERSVISLEPTAVNTEADFPGPFFIVFGSPPRTHPRLHVRSLRPLGAVNVRVEQADSVTARRR